jgi:hypothetical protein
MRKVTLLVLILIPWFVTGQTKTNYYDKFVKFNYWNIDTSNQDIHAVAGLWKKYLINRLYGYSQKNDTTGLEYWNEEERKLYHDPDMILERDPWLNIIQTNILEIRPVENGFYRILNVKAEVDSAGEFKTNTIYYVLAKNTGGKFRLFSYLYLEKKKMNRKVIGNICYYYPQNYPFSKINARKFLIFQDSLSVLFSCPEPKSLIYIVDKDNPAMLSHLGYVYYSIGTALQGGTLMKNEDMILSSRDENHRHELVHYFTRAINPDVIGFFDEGLATWFGGNLGHDLQWHLNFLNDYLKNRPDIDVSDENKFSYINAGTNPQYVLGSIIIKYTIDKFGFHKVIELLKYSKKKFNYKDVVEQEIGLKKTDLNSFFRNYLMEHATKTH